MVAPFDNLSCQKAKSFYYNYLTGDGGEDIPRELIEHIDRCTHCEAEIDKLQAKLENTEHRVDDDILLTNLELQYNFVDQPVSCNMVKSFLPLLALPAMDVRVPTPITAHIDNCPQCAEDFKAICDLKLTYGQLCVLGRVYAQESASDPELCGKALGWVDEVATMNFQQIPVEILKHFCTCHECRQALQSKRHELVDNIGWSEEQSLIPCESVKASDLFDYVIPYGVEPANDQYAKFRSSLTSHLVSCKECLTKMSNLHDEIYGILERQESNVISIFKSDRIIQDGTNSKVADENLDYPIAIEVLDKEKDVVRLEDVRPKTNLNPSIQSNRFKPFLKPMVAAAAILLVVFLVFNGSEVNALDMRQIYKALEKVNNVHLMKYQSEDSKLINEIWISQPLNLKIIKDPTGSALWNLGSKELKIKDVGTNAINTSRLDSETIKNIKSTMHAPWSLLPFNSVTEIPHDAVWQEVIDERIVSNNLETEIYDLSWTKKTTSDALRYCKRRCFVDINSHLPQRIEFWDKFNSTEEYKLETIIEIDYPTHDQIRQTIEQLGF